MLPCFLKCRKNTGSKDLKFLKTTNGKIMLLRKCPVFKNSRFIKAQKTNVEPIRNYNSFEQDTIV